MVPLQEIMYVSNYSLADGKDKKTKARDAFSGHMQQNPTGTENVHHESLSGYNTNLQMANERTFLAWLRTSLSLVTIGIGIVQLLKLKNEFEDLSRYAKPLGASFVFIGIMTLVMGTLRYFRVQTMLLSSYYPASQFLVTLLVGTVFLLVVVTLGLLFLA